MREWTIDRLIFIWEFAVFRVLNVIRQWVDKYFNDLLEANDHQLLDQLKMFLQEIPDAGGLYQIKNSILKLIDKQVSESHWGLIPNDEIFQTIDYQDPAKKNQRPDLISDERDQIEDLDVFIVRIVCPSST